MGAGALIGGLLGNMYGERQDNIDNQLKSLQQQNSTIFIMVKNSNNS